MSRGLIRSLLLIVEKADKKISPGKEVSKFLEENNLGERSGKYWLLSRKDRQMIRKVLENEYDIAEHATHDSWKGLSRHEALSFGGNEKMTSKAVRSEIVAIKPMPGEALHLESGKSCLPDGAAVILPWRSVKISAAHHDRLIVVENWEAFERLHCLMFDIPSEFQNAIAIYRGEQAGYRTEAVHDWLSNQRLPVYVFSDQDMAGLEIAITTPGFAGLFFPPLETLRDMFLQGKGLRDRYLSQNTKSGVFLSKCHNAEVCQYRDLINEFGRAIPQEWFVRNKSDDL
jgi:hypothetical protein